MIIRINREIFNEHSTISKVYINDEYFCDLLEDVDRGLYFTQPLEEILAKKVYGKTAIPRGIYEVAITYSDRFKKYLPLLLNVPGYSGIRIHPGNTEVDTLGCLLPGKSTGTKVIQSVLTFNKLFSIIKSTIKTEKVFVAIESSKI